MFGLKQITRSIILGLLLAFMPTVVSAHVVVRPAEVKTASFQTFTIGVPNEKDASTVGVKITLPEGLQYISPTVKPGWRITIDKEGQGESAVVKAITWTEGEIPTGQRDDFSFSAKVPGEPTKLQWNAYQTYSTGEVVSWDQAPSAQSEEESTLTGPYSSTQVVTALAVDTDMQRVQQSTADAKTASSRAFYLGLTGVLVGLGVLVLFLQNRK